MASRCWKGACRFWNRGLTFVDCLLTCAIPSGGLIQQGVLVRTCAPISHPSPTLVAADGSSSSGLLVSDRVTLANGSGFDVDMRFGVEQRQTGVLQSMGLVGLLGLDRSSTSFVGQVGQAFAA